jgi:hypothetical protein
MIDGEMLPAIRLDVAQCRVQFLRIAVVTGARFGISILQRIDLECAIILAANDAAGFVRRIYPRLGDELGELVAR